MPKYEKKARLSLPQSDSGHGTKADLFSSLSDSIFEHAERIGLDTGEQKALLDREKGTLSTNLKALGDPGILPEMAHKRAYRSVGRKLLAEDIRSAKTSALESVTRQWSLHTDTVFLDWLSMNEQNLANNLNASREALEHSVSAMRELFPDMDEGVFNQFVQERLVPKIINLTAKARKKALDSKRENDNESLVTNMLTGISHNGLFDGKDLSDRLLRTFAKGQNTNHEFGDADFRDEVNQGLSRFKGEVSLPDSDSLKEALTRVRDYLDGARHAESRGVPVNMDYNGSYDTNAKELISAYVDNIVPVVINGVNTEHPHLTGKAYRSAVDNALAPYISGVHSILDSRGLGFHGKHKYVTSAFNSSRDTQYSSESARQVEAVAKKESLDTDTRLLVSETNAHNTQNPSYMKGLVLSVLRGNEEAVRSILSDSQIIHGKSLEVNSGMETAFQVQGLAESRAVLDVVTHFSDHATTKGIVETIKRHVDHMTNDDHTNIDLSSGELSTIIEQSFMDTFGDPDIDPKEMHHYQKAARSMFHHATKSILDDIGGHMDLIYNIDYSSIYENAVDNPSPSNAVGQVVQLIEKAEESYNYPVLSIKNKNYASRLLNESNESARPNWLYDAHTAHEMSKNHRTLLPVLRPQHATRMYASVVVGNLPFSMEDDSIIEGMLKNQGTRNLHEWANKNDVGLSNPHNLGITNANYEYVLQSTFKRNLEKYQTSDKANLDKEDEKAVSRTMFEPYNDGVMSVDLVNGSPFRITENLYRITPRHYYTGIRYRSDGSGPNTKNELRLSSDNSTEVELHFPAPDADSEPYVVKGTHDDIGEAIEDNDLHIIKVSSNNGAGPIYAIGSQDEHGSFIPATNADGDTWYIHVPSHAYGEHALAEKAFLHDVPWRKVD